jgi:hypothetical protein
VAVWMTEAPPEVTPSDRPRKRVVVIAIDDGRLKTNGGAVWGVLKARTVARTIVEARTIWQQPFSRSTPRPLRTSSQIDINERTCGLASRSAITFVVVRSHNQPDVVGYRALATDGGATWTPCCARRRGAVERQQDPLFSDQTLRSLHSQLGSELRQFSTNVGLGSAFDDTRSRTDCSQLVSERRRVTVSC